MNKYRMPIIFFLSAGCVLQTSVIPDVLTEPRDLAVARAESQYSDRLLVSVHVI